jgi:small-conductance mechanosensitive channel
MTCILARVMQFPLARTDKKEDTTMKTTIARKTAYIGAGSGLVLFALFGLLPGSLVGGAMGINIAGWLFGLPLQPGLVSRIIVLASMLTGVLVAGIVIVTAAATAGWLVGLLLESGVHAKEAGKNEASAPSK